MTMWVIFCFLVRGKTKPSKAHYPSDQSHWKNDYYSNKKIFNKLGIPRRLIQSQSWSLLRYLHDQAKELNFSPDPHSYSLIVLPCLVDLFLVNLPFQHWLLLLSDWKWNRIWPHAGWERLLLYLLPSRQPLLPPRLWTFTRLLPISLLLPRRAGYLSGHHALQLVGGSHAGEGLVASWRSLFKLQAANI